MRYVFCTLGSIGSRGGVYIPVSASIPEGDWRVLAKHLRPAAVATNCPATAALTASVLPKVAEISELPPLLEEVPRLAASLPEGPAASAAGLLHRFLEQAAEYVESWRAGGEPTKLSAAFQLMENRYAVRNATSPAEDPMSGRDEKLNEDDDEPRSRQ